MSTRQIKIKDADVAEKYYNVIEAGTAAEPHEPVIPPYAVTYAIGKINSDDSVEVSVQEKAKSLNLYGKNASIASGTAETVWVTGGTETYLTANSITDVVSANAGDTQDVIIEGYTYSAPNFTYVSQTATLNGTSAVTLTTALCRAERVYNNDNTDFAGVVTVLINGGATHLTTIGNQSQKCQTTTASTDYFIITSASFTVDRGAAAKVDFEIEVRESLKMFRTLYGCTVSDTGGTYDKVFDIPIIVPPNSDVRIIATSNATCAVKASLHGYLGIVT